jgi:hypothetical protein
MGMGMIEVLIFMILVAILFFAIPTFLQWLWNMTIPELFGLKGLTYWQAFRLLLIAGLLFGPGAFLRFNFGGPPFG